MNHIMIAIATLVTCTVASTCFAGDYSYSIGPYEYVRCNGMETLICDSLGSIVFSPLDFPETGPVFRYAYTPQHLVLNTYSRAKTNDDGLLAKVDRKNHKIFLVDLSDDSVTGPHTIEALSQLSSVPHESLRWKTTIYPILPQLIALATIPLALIAACTWFIIRWRTNPSAGNDG